MVQFPAEARDFSLLQSV